MEVAQKIQAKLERLLNRLKGLRIIQTFELDIRFCEIEDSLKTHLIEIDSVLKKCLKKIITKPRKAEIRNIITELIRKKNLNDFPNSGQDESEKQIKSSHQEKGKFENVSVHKISSHCHGNDIPLVKRTCDTSELEYDPEENLLTHNSLSTNLNLYLCETCGEMFNDVLGWKIHKRKHFTTLRVECEKCSMSFPSYKKLKTHIKTHKNKDDMIESEHYTEGVVLSRTQPMKENFIICFICKGSFQSKNLLTQHLVEEHNRSSVERIEKENYTLNDDKFICDCGRVFHLLNTLKRHKILKHSSKSITYSCSQCKKSFTERGKLNRHMLSHKNSQFKCSFCFKQFSRSDVLKRHLSLSHNPQKNYSCNFCNKKFNLKYNRDVHEENIHKNMNNWIQCEHCGQKFRNKLTFKSHLKIHLEKPVTCSICNKSFNRKVNYKNHMKNKHFGISPFQTLLDSVTAEFGD